MDNRTALILAIVIAAFVAFDAFYLDWGVTVGVGKMLERVIEWMAFWR